MKRPIIIGIDPGTTSAYAVLDVKGKVLEVYSAKEMDLAMMIRRVSKLGLPVIVSGDKKTTPEFVRQFATKTGAKLNINDEDILVSEKRLLVKGLNTKNDHERDSLACAIIAYQNFRILINKILRYVKNNDKEKIKNRLLHDVITKGISISLAVSIIEEPEKEETKIIKKVIEEVDISKHSSKMVEKMHEIYESNTMLETENKKLRNALRKERREKNLLLKNMEQATETKVKNVLKKKEDVSLINKDAKISQLQKKLKEKSKQYNRVVKDIKKLMEVVLNAESYMTIERLPRLDSDFMKRKIKSGSVLYIDDLTSYSQKAVKKAKKASLTIITQKTSKELKTMLTILDERYIKVKKLKGYCFADKEDIKKELGKTKILDKVISDYKQSRQV